MLKDWRVAIVKPVGNACNLRCKYCFYNGQSQAKSKLMSDELLERFIIQFLGLFPGSKSFIWHGGEPTLAGLQFYQRAMVLQEQHRVDDCKVVNYIQTNGTLINDEWASFFKEHSFKVGVSLDGNRNSHDRFRVDASGDGSFDRVMKGISYLRKHEVRFGLIMTLTKDNLPDLENNLDFVRTFGVGVATNDYDTSSSSVELKAQGIDADLACQVWSRSLDWWLNANDQNLRFREIDNIISGVLGHQPRNCTYNGTCHHYFCLHNDGEVYPCDRLSWSKANCLGDLNQEGLEEILRGSKASEHLQRTQKLPSDCQACEHLRVCNNGCTALRSQQTGKYVFCESRKRAYLNCKELMP